MVDKFQSNTAHPSPMVSFTFERGPVRTVSRDGQTWFFLADLCRAIGIRNPSQAATRFDDDEKATLRSSEGSQFNGLGRLGAMPTIVSEPGAYTLIRRSRKPEAKRFDRWVRHEVLPSIRKTGSYALHTQREPTAEEIMTQAVALATAVMKEAAERHRETGGGPQYLTQLQVEAEVLQ